MNKPKIFIFSIILCLATAIQPKNEVQNYTPIIKVCSDEKGSTIITPHSSNGKVLIKKSGNSQAC